MSNSNIITINAYSDYQTEIAAQQEKLKEGTIGGLYVVLYASLTNEDGESWCGDCRTAIPVIREKFGGMEDTVLLEVFVGDRDSWKVNPESNEYRNDETLKATAVPTLFAWGKDGVGASLVEDDVNDAEKLDAFLKQ